MTVERNNMGSAALEASLAASTLMMQLDEVIDLPFCLDHFIQNEFGYSTAKQRLETEKDLQLLSHDERSQLLSSRTHQHLKHRNHSPQTVKEDNKNFTFNKQKDDNRIRVIGPISPSPFLDRLPAKRTSTSKIYLVHENQAQQQKIFKIAANKSSIGSQLSCSEPDLKVLSTDMHQKVAVSKPPRRGSCKRKKP